MSTPFATPTPTFHKTPYPAISPTLPSLSVAGKTIIITGGGSGIGRALVLAFASAGASRICILGRRLSALHETRSIAERQFPNLIVERYSADVTDASAVREVAAQIGKWDVLCLNAGYLADLKGMGECDVDDWWRGFEVNVKGPFVCLQAFMPNRNREGRPVVIETNAASIQAPAVFMPGWSTYSSSKAAAVKVMEFAAGEKEWADTHFVSFHPGIVDTDITKKVFGGKQDEAEAKAKGQDLDDIELSSHFAVWLASPEAAFLRGKFAWCNWDVSELKERADEIRNSALLTENIVGVPLTGLAGPIKEWQHVSKPN